MLFFFYFFCVFCVCLSVCVCVFFSVDLRVFSVLWEGESGSYSCVSLGLFVTLKSYRIEKKEQGLFTNFVSLITISILTGNFPSLWFYVCESVCMLCAKQHFFSLRLILNSVACLPSCFCSCNSFVLKTN